jgi:hypothetical protein
MASLAEGGYVERSEFTGSVSHRGVENSYRWAPVAARRSVALNRENCSAVGITDVPFYRLDVVLGRRFDNRVLARDWSVLGASALSTPSR